MRWIFVSLLVASLSLFAWKMVFVGESHSSQSVSVSKRDPFPDVDAIRLLSESDLGRRQVTVTVEPLPDVVGSSAAGASGEFLIGESGQPLPESVEDVDKVDAPMSDGKPLCEMVGAFAAKRAAVDFVERLLAIDVRSEVKELDLPVGEGYWVYLKPTESRKEAYRKLGEIQSRGIDSYVIPKGDLENGISLGVYSQKSLAKERVRKMKVKGLEPLLKEIERTYREVWVMLKHGEGLKMSNLSWERALKGENNLERRQNFCLDVASPGNFH